MNSNINNLIKSVDWQYSEGGMIDLILEAVGEIPFKLVSVHRDVLKPIAHDRNEVLKLASDQVALGNYKLLHIEVDDVRNVGWLNRTNADITLPCCVNEFVKPFFVVISREQYRELVDIDGGLQKYATDNINSGNAYR